MVLYDDVVEKVEECGWYGVVCWCSREGGGVWLVWCCMLM